jgi:hypothetical protein
MLDGEDLLRNNKITSDKKKLILAHVSFTEN